MKPDALFRPFTCRSLQLDNRIVMAPMTRSFSPGGVPGEDVAAYYQRRGAGGCSLLITEGTGIDRPASLNDPRIPRFHGSDAMAGWSSVAAQVHATGAKIAPQIWHVGAIEGRDPAVADISWESPSGRANDSIEVGHAMSETDIAATIAAFGEAAAAAKAVGFDAIEIHGAHGYLIDQFFWHVTNQRTDGWGGDLAARTRFGVEVVRAVRAAVGEDMAIIFRLSQFKLRDYEAKVATTPTELETWLTPLANAGVDIFHCSQRRFWEPEFEGSDLNLAGWAKKVTGLPTITVGSVSLSGGWFVASLGGEATQPSGIDALLERLERGEFDLVAVGRALLTDPAWPRKVREGRFDEFLGFDRADAARLT